MRPRRAGPAAAALVVALRAATGCASDALMRYMTGGQPRDTEARRPSCCRVTVPGAMAVVSRFPAHWAATTWPLPVAGCPPAGSACALSRLSESSRREAPATGRPRCCPQG